MTANFQYQCLLRNILSNGEWLSTRGTRSKYVFNASLQFDLRKEFPAISLRNAYPKSSIDEAQHDINGQPFNINKLKSKGLRLAWKAFVNKFNIVPNTYGRQLRNWPASDVSHNSDSLGKLIHGNQTVDQYSNVLNNLRTNPTSRGHVAIIHNPTSIEAQTTCQTSIVFSSNGEYIDASLFCRSSDAMFGLVGDIIRYAVHLHVLAYLSGLKPRFLALTLVNAHIYEESIEDAKRLAYSDYQPELLPQFFITSATDNFEFTYNLVGYQPNKEFKLESKTIVVGDLSDYGL